MQDKFIMITLNPFDLMQTIKDKRCIINLIKENNDYPQLSCPWRQTV